MRAGAMAHTIADMRTMTVTMTVKIAVTMAIIDAYIAGPAHRL